MINYTSTVATRKSTDDGPVYHTKVQIPLNGPDQTLSETRVSHKSADFVWSGPVPVVEFGANRSLSSG